MMEGKRISPYCKPLEVWKKSVGVSLTKTNTLIVEMQKGIHFLRLGPKSIFSIIEKRNFQATWSYAFSISNSQTKIDLKFLFLKSIASSSIKATSRICLPPTKAFWLSNTTFPIILLAYLLELLLEAYKDCLQG